MHKGFCFPMLISHLRACRAFPAGPLQPASDLLSQKRQPLYAHSYRIRRKALFRAGNVFGSFTQFPCSAERSNVLHLLAKSRSCHKSQSSLILPFSGGIIAHRPMQRKGKQKSPHRCQALLPAPGQASDGAGSAAASPQVVLRASVSVQSGICKEESVWKPAIRNKITFRLPLW